MDKATHLLTADHWQKQQTWDDNQFHAKSLLNWTASTIGDNTVQQAIETALAANPDLLLPMLRGIAQWMQQHDSMNPTRVVGFHQTIDEIPPWLPLQAVVAEINRQLPDLIPAQDYDIDTESDDLPRLASHVLRVAGTAA